MFQIRPVPSHPGFEAVSNRWIISNKWSIFGEMKQTRILLIAVLFIPLFACSSRPAPVEIPEAQSEEAVAAEIPVEEPAGGDVFDPSKISQEVIDSTKSDVQKLIADLNRIIRAKNYNTWVSYLAKSYFEKISSEEFLASVSAQPSLKSKKITLTSARDYFEKVVVPSRANDRLMILPLMTLKTGSKSTPSTARGSGYVSTTLTTSGTAGKLSIN